jgi:arsenite methyltransferase
MDTVLDFKHRKPDYGIDAPGLVFAFFGAGIAMLFAAALMGLALPSWRAMLLPLVVLAACYCLGMGTLTLVWSKVIKLKTRDVILSKIPWRGDERVLDVGCGRGLLLTAAAKRLTTGGAIGIDIWNGKDQSGNGSESALLNAQIEGVADRVNIDTGDMRKLPYADNSFDVVMSHWVVHNLPDEAERGQTLAEMHRVLKSGGRLVLADIEHREVYWKQLLSLGFANIEVDFHPVLDGILRFISGGSFGPSTIYALKNEGERKG